MCCYRQCAAFLGPRLAIFVAPAEIRGVLGCVKQLVGASAAAATVAFLT